MFGISGCLVGQADLQRFRTEINMSQMRFHLVGWLVLLLQQVAGAQVLTGIPNENELNRLGLTMAWWGQAAVNRSLDSIEFFSADEQNVYVQSSTGLVTTFQGEAGKRIWTQLVGSPDQQSTIISTSEQDALIGIGVKLYCYNKFTGHQQYILNLPSPPSTAPVCDETYLYVASLDGQVRAYNATILKRLSFLGKMPTWSVQADLWNFQMPRATSSSPIPQGEDVVFASDRGIVYRVAAKDKVLKYQLEVGAPLAAPLAHGATRFFTADNRGRLLCLDLMTGKSVWEFSSGSALSSAPCVIGNRLYVFAAREGLVAVNLDSGLRLWHHPNATQFVAASERRVYASDAQNNLLILDRETGRELAILRIRDYPTRVVNVRTDRIYIAGPGGTVIALHELGIDYPIFHLYPDRRPILPVITPDEPMEPKEPMEQQETN